MQEMIQQKKRNRYISALPIQIRGPYGVQFTKAFDAATYPSVIMIGAGTGVTSAMSVLREMIALRQQNRDRKQYVWFVWSCANVDDLLWAWDLLKNDIIAACHDGAINPSKDWNPTVSSHLDWLSMTFYVTRSDHALFKKFMEQNVTATQDHAQLGPALSLLQANLTAAASADTIHFQSPFGKENSNQMPTEEEDIYAAPTASLYENVRGLNRADDLDSWMKSQILESSMDNKSTDILSLFETVNVFMEDKRDEYLDLKRDKTCICYCGNSALSRSIHSHALTAFGKNGMDYTAEAI
jgi:hypothetical protein